MNRRRLLASLAAIPAAIVCRLAGARAPRPDDIPRVQPGQPLRADDVNCLIDRVNALHRESVKRRSPEAA